MKRDHLSRGKKPYYWHVQFRKHIDLTRGLHPIYELKEVKYHISSIDMFLIEILGSGINNTLRLWKFNHVQSRNLWPSWENEVLNQWWNGVPMDRRSKETIFHISWYIMIYHVFSILNGHFKMTESMLEACWTVEPLRNFLKQQAAEHFGMIKNSWDFVITGDISNLSYLKQLFSVETPGFTLKDRGETSKRIPLKRRDGKYTLLVIGHNLGMLGNTEIWKFMTMKYEHSKYSKFDRIMN